MDLLLLLWKEIHVSKTPKGHKKFIRAIEKHKKLHEHAKFLPTEVGIEFQQ